MDQNLHVHDTNYGSRGDSRNQHASSRNDYHDHSQGGERYTTEECKFWKRVGACRHGHSCAKRHNRPKVSKTVVFWNLFNNPVRTLFNKSNGKENAEKDSDVFSTVDVHIDERKLQEEAERLYQDLFVELSMKYGEIETIVICGNYNVHIGGNVLVKFSDERAAANCVRSCNDRWYNGKPIFCELSPVARMEDSFCRPHLSHRGCERGDTCNMIHPREPRRDIKATLFASQKEFYKEECF
jgi:splicing factor U2AF 35 kDa subunit